MTPGKAASRVGEVLRFLVVGGLNTLATLCIYWLLLPHVEYAVAYTISFIAGILSGYALNTCVVFKARWSWRRLMAFPFVHVVNYILGMGVIWLAVGVSGLDARLGPVVAVVVTLPVNFLLTRRLIAGKRRDP